MRVSDQTGLVEAMRQKRLGLWLPLVMVSLAKEPL